MSVDDVLTRPAAADALSDWDDYPIHQQVSLLCEIAPALPGWSERFYFNLQRPTGELVAIVGGGVYPARGLSECYFCRLDGDRQLNIRASQPLGTADGQPFSMRVEEPMRRWTVAVRDGDGMLLEAAFNYERAAHLFAPLDIPASTPGGGFDSFRHFVSSGTVPDGVPFANGPLLSARDRTWGVRTRRARLHNWYVLHLAGCYLALIHQELADGSVHFSEAMLLHDDGEKEALRITGHELAFDPEDRSIRSGSVQFEGSQRRLELEYERVGLAIRLAGAGYDDRQGERGDSRALQRDEYDLGDRAVAAATGRGTMDAGVRARVSDRSWSADGVGVVETAIARDHVAYGAQLRPVADKG
jgi:hypothetical protein